MLCHATLRIPNPKQKVWSCTLLALLGMLGGGGIAQIGTTFYDNITSLGLFTSALLVIHFFEGLLHASPKRALLLAILCGLPAGLMMGLKLPFVVFCVGLCGALLFVSGAVTRRIWIAFGFGIGVIIGLSLTLGPWAAFLQSHYQSPLFPISIISSNPHSHHLPAYGTSSLFRPHGLTVCFFPFIFTSSPFRVGGNSVA